jgi:hypothetical protein
MKFKSLALLSVVLFLACSLAVSAKETSLIAIDGAVFYADGTTFKDIKVGSATIDVITAVSLKGSINGHVIDSKTGAPIKWALVIAIQKPIREWTLTRRDGYYELRDLPAGDWWIIVIKAGYKTGFAKVTVEAGKTTTKDFELCPT